MKRKLLLLVVLAALLSGCAGYQRVQHPPRVNLGSTVAVLFFDNFTDDYAISHEVEQELVKTLSGYYRVLPPAEVEWALVRLGLLRGQSPDPNQAIRLGQMLGVDALVMGEVSGYFQPVTQTPPYPTGREMIDERDNKLYQYEYVENTQVMVSFTGRGHGHPVGQRDPPPAGAGPVLQRAQGDPPLPTGVVAREPQAHYLGSACPQLFSGTLGEAERDPGGYQPVYGGYHAHLHLGKGAVATCPGLTD